MAISSEMGILNFAFQEYTLEAYNNWGIRQWINPMSLS